jgi:hypothetical protein
MTTPDIKAMASILNKIDGNRSDTNDSANFGDTYNQSAKLMSDTGGNIRAMASILTRLNESSIDDSNADSNSAELASESDIIKIVSVLGSLQRVLQMSRSKINISKEQANEIKHHLNDVYQIVIAPKKRN